MSMPAVANKWCIGCFSVLGSAFLACARAELPGVLEETVAQERAAVALLPPEPVDSDSDCVPDFEESGLSDPLDPDTDDDGCSDGPDRYFPECDVQAVVSPCPSSLLEFRVDSSLVGSVGSFYWLPLEPSQYAPMAIPSASPSTPEISELNFSLESGERWVEAPFQLPAIYVDTSRKYYFKARLALVESRTQAILRVRNVFFRSQEAYPSSP